MYLSRLKEEILAIGTKLGYSNLTREEKKALKPLKDDVDIIIIKEAEGGIGGRSVGQGGPPRGFETTWSNTYEEVFGDCVKISSRVFQG